ncbi:hypothetical protein FNI11_02610 [Salmonella enterica subsp. salamae]|nr:hypothetical protein [Salmonella enterica subsp. salamae]ECJ2279816.1 hypothetical protein [Salmonella enterica subsp. salamae]
MAMRRRFIRPTFMRFVGLISVAPSGTFAGYRPIRNHCPQPLPHRLGFFLRNLWKPGIKAVAGAINLRLDVKDFNPCRHKGYGLYNLHKGQL